MFASDDENWGTGPEPESVCLFDGVLFGGYDSGEYGCCSGRFWTVIFAIKVMDSAPGGVVEIEDFLCLVYFSSDGCI